MLSVCAIQGLIMLSVCAIQGLIGQIHLGDCLEIMRQMPDKSVDLVLTDPPYGLGVKSLSGGGKIGKSFAAYKDKDWDVVPQKEYFEQILRVSKNQIICGGNYFNEFLSSSRGIIWWDKMQAFPNMSAGELIWTSFQTPARQFRIQANQQERIHPTQKPLELFTWLLQTYSKPEDVILDPYSGSGTTAVACTELGRKFICIEMDPDYHASSTKRLEQFQAQGRLF